MAAESRGPSKPAADPARAKILEGVDFIETEEDAEAVESAVVKIQSTFRGKKIRSKLGQKQAAAPSNSNADDNNNNNNNNSHKSKAPEATPNSSASSSSSLSHSKPDSSAPTKASAKATTKQHSSAELDDELNKKVASMQVNDNSQQQAKQQAANAPAANLPEEAERAATKIQAGFKGYKTRKELEGKLGQQGTPQAGQQEAQQDSAKEPNGTK